MCVCVSVCVCVHPFMDIQESKCSEDMHTHNRCMCVSGVWTHSCAMYDPTFKNTAHPSEW